MMVAVLLVILVVLLGFSAFFSSAEVALFSLNPLQVHRLVRNSPGRGILVERLLLRPVVLLSTILLGNTVVNVCASVTGFALLERLFPGRGAGLAIPVMTVVLLVFGEIGPKRVAVAFSERMATMYAPLLSWLTQAVAPLNRLLGRLRLPLRGGGGMQPETITVEELETIVDITGQHGGIDAEEERMVRAVIRLCRLRAADIMTPRVDLQAADVDLPGGELLRRARESWTRYLLVCRGSLERIVGILDVKMFLLDPRHRRERALLPAVYIPETVRLDKLLAQFITERLRIALVVDEYGGLAGVVTRGDILEELTGQIEDEMGEPVPVLEEAGPHRWVLDGRWNLEDINDRIGVSLSSESADRLSGWVMEHLQRMPRPGDVVTAQQVRIRVLDVKKHRIGRLLLEKLEDSAA